MKRTLAIAALAVLLTAFLSGAGRLTVNPGDLAAGSFSLSESGSFALIGASLIGLGLIRRGRAGHRP